MIKTNINFVKGKKFSFVFSTIVLLTCLLSIFVFRGFNQGIDFTGGLAATLTINFEESDISVLRDLFSAVELRTLDATSEAGAEQDSIVIENLGRNIAQLEKRSDELDERISETYVIRIKNIEGVDKDEIERALTDILAKEFAQKTEVSLKVSSLDPEDDGTLLNALLAPFEMAGDYDSFKMTIREDLLTNEIRVFNIRKEFDEAVNETAIRNGLTKAFLEQRQYELKDAVEFHQTIDWGSFSSVSSAIGKELQESAIWLSLACVLIMLFYIAVRFDFRFGVAAVTALVHDVLIIIGIVSLTGKELNVPVIAAVLTIFGYSINDTIVVFDRIREHLKFSRKEDLPGIVNRSINETLSRTIITSGTTMLAALSIYLFAGDVLRDFAFALIFGIIFGTYSSIFIASPVYLLMEKLTEKRKAKKRLKKS